MSCDCHVTARVEIEGVERYPTSADARRINIELAVQFLRQDGVNLQPDPVKGLYIVHVHSVI